MTADFYKTVAGPAGPSVFKDRGSKFMGYVFPVHTEEQVKQHLARIRKTHHKARHWCYAWRMGTGTVTERANDDGEPARSAGMPILNQIAARELTDTLVVVVRYFGGVKLGVGGLIRAYKTAASDALDMADVVRKPVTRLLRIQFPYARMNDVMQAVKQAGGEIIAREMADDVLFQVSLLPGKVSEFSKRLERFDDVKLQDV